MRNRLMHEVRFQVCTSEQTNPNFGFVVGRMRTKTCARARVRFSKYSHRPSSSATARPLPSPIPDDISNPDDSTDLGERYNSSGSGGDPIEDEEAVVKTCLKCNEGEQLLFCSGTGCAIAVHEKCLASEPKYEKKGNFYCPYCWVKIQEAKAKASLRKAMLAKEALQAFMAIKSLAGTDKYKQDDVRTKGNDPNIDQNLGENNQCEHVNSMDVDDEVQDGTEKVEKEHQVDSNVNIVHVDDEVHSGTGKVDKEHQIDGNVKLPDKNTVVTERARTAETHACEILEDEGGMEKERDDRQVVDEKDEEINANEVSTEKENDDHQVIDEKVEGINVEEGSMKEGKDNQPRQAQVHAEKSSPLERNMEPRVPANKVTKWSFAHEKRKRLHWMAEEEDMLREGVQVFSAKVNKNLPWRKILEFGRHVFDRSRTPSDLKDKWRNIVAKDTLAANRGPS